ncbi:hCG1999409 [Homo sapiens]|nr:hCG1999409 [Homo sapiens]
MHLEMPMTFIAAAYVRWSSPGMPKVDIQGVAVRIPPVPA